MIYLIAIGLAIGGIVSGWMVRGWADNALRLDDEPDEHLHLIHGAPLEQDIEAYLTTHCAERASALDENACERDDGSIVSHDCCAREIRAEIGDGIARWRGPNDR